MLWPFLGKLNNQIDFKMFMAVCFISTKLLVYCFVIYIKNGVYFKSEITITEVSKEPIPINVIVFYQLFFFAFRDTDFHTIVESIMTMDRTPVDSFDITLITFSLTYIISINKKLINTL